MKNVGATGFEAACHLGKWLIYSVEGVGVYFGTDWNRLLGRF